MLPTGGSCSALHLKSARARHSAPCVSVAIPCYNGESYLARCLKSIHQQTLHPVEVIVVDDASSDNSVMLAARLGARVIRHDRRRGAAAARNTAIKNATSDLIALVDADTELAVDWLERLSSYFSDPSVAGAGGALIERPSPRLADQWRAVHLRCDMARLLADERSFCLLGHGTLFRRNALIQAGLYNERYICGGEDSDICYRLRRMGWKLVYDPDAISYHNKRDSAISVAVSAFRYWAGSQDELDRLKIVGAARHVSRELLWMLIRIASDCKHGRFRLIPLDVFVFGFVAWRYIYTALVPKRGASPAFVDAQDRR